MHQAHIKLACMQSIQQGLEQTVQLQLKWKHQVRKVHNRLIVTLIDDIANSYISSNI